MIREDVTYGDYYIDASKYRELMSCAIAPGDILMSLVGTAGKVLVMPKGAEPGVINPRLIRIRTDDSVVLPQFLAHFFRSSEAQLQLSGLAQGGTMGVLNASTVGSLRVPIPPRKEQERICEILDDSDALIASLERAVAKRQAIKQGLIQQLLTGRIRLPGFTKQWRDIRLGDHVTYAKTVALSRAQLDDESSLRYLHYGDIHTNTGVRLGAATADMPRVKTALAASAGLLMVGDVVFADASEDPTGVGKSVEVTSVPSEGVVPGLHTIAARFDKSVLADGFKAYLQFIPDFRNSLLRLAAGTKVLATTRNYISSITVSLPAVDEQIAIAQVLRDADDEIDALRHRFVKARSVKQGMMQELLTGPTRLQSVEMNS